MNRRQFLKRGFLGSAGVVVASQVLARAPLDLSNAHETVEYAVRYALSSGYQYADARLGRCEEAANDHPERLGLRLIGPNGQRQMVLESWTKTDIREAIRHSLRTYEFVRDHDHRTLIFEEENHLAFASSHPDMAQQNGDLWLRYSPAPTAPDGRAIFSYVDILLDQ